MTRILAAAAATGLLLASLALAGCQKLGTPANGEPIAEALRLPDLAGAPFDPAVLAGKRALVMFWSTSCGTCLDELPEIQQVAEGGDCEVVTVVVKGAPEHAETVAEQLGITLPILVDERGELRAMLGFKATPTTYALGPDGRAIRFVQGGYGQKRLSKLCDG